MLTADGVDVAAALAWAREAIGPVAAVRDLHGGWTSTMLALTTHSDDDVVLRLMTREPWRTHGEGLTTRESDVQEMRATTPVPAPHTVALAPQRSRLQRPRFSRDSPSGSPPLPAAAGSAPSSEATGFLSLPSYRGTSRAAVGTKPASAAERRRTP